MEVDGVKPGGERMPLEKVEAEAEVDADTKRNVPSGIVKVEDNDAKPVVDLVVKEPSLKDVESEIDMMDEQTQPPVGSDVDEGSKKKRSLASRILKRMKSTIGRGKDQDKDNLKDIKKKGWKMDLALRSALKSALDLLHLHGRQEGRPGATQ